MQIPGYRIIRKINDGGMSSVYLAVQLSVGREVALKVMSPVLNADPIFSQRFQREANIVGQLSHPSIVSIYDIGCHNNLNYIAMDYLPGGTVHDKMKENLSATESLKIIKEIAVALQVSHTKGYIHRDLKPDNILFREDDTAVLSDFGVAKAVSAATKVTNAGTVVGTPHYMSPEQSRGLSIDGRSDIYSLGIVFYEMLTGSVPFQAEESIAIAIKHLTAPVPTLPPQFSIYQELINRMLAKSPDKRFQSGLDLVTAITIIEDTLSGYQRGTSPTDTTGMTVMTLFKALLLTSYAALRHQLSIWFSKILSWRWTPNRGFFSHPNIKVTEIQTISNTRDEELKTIISTRIQKAAHYQEIASRKIGTITRGFTLVLIASIIWSSFCVGLTRTNIAYEKIMPEFLEHAITSTANVILAYSNRFTGKDKNAAPYIATIERAVEPDQSKKITALVTQNEAYVNNITQASETPKAIGNRYYNYSDPTSRDQWRSEFETNITLLGDPNRKAVESDTSEERQNSQNQSTEKLSSKQQNISFEDSIETKLIDESDQVEDIVREETTTEETITNETSISKTKETLKPTYTLTINTAPNDARVRVLNIREKYKGGMSLNAGRYHIEVSKPGFKTVKQWLRITNKSIFQDYSLESSYKLGDSIIDTLADGGSGPELRIITGGRFTMGKKGQAHTSPEHTVNIKNTFAISQYEVTFAAYQKYVAATNAPSPKDAKWGKASRPVINVSWDDAVKYTQWLSEQTDEYYRLPTEAEWEYLARAGSTTDYWWGGKPVKKMANCKRGCDSDYAGVFKGKTAPVGSYSANSFSVYDTAGNVAEWTLDCYEDHYVNAPSDGSALNNSQCKLRSVRGGSAKDNAKNLFNYSRSGLKENTRSNYVGFRVLRELD